MTAAGRALLAALLVVLTAGVASAETDRATVIHVLQRLSYGPRPGDVERVRIGARTNVQDNATVHVTKDRWPAILGDGVTVGHNAVVHGCTIGDRCLIGIGAIVLDGAVLERECLVGAGAVVTPGTRVPAGSLVLGQPGKVVRALSADEIAGLHRSADGYVERLALYRAGGVR